MIPFLIKNRYSIIAVALLTLVLFWVMSDVLFKPNIVPGTDSYWHIALIDEAFDRFSTGQPIGPISETVNGGRPYLYGTGTTYPQFSYWVGLGTSIVFGSAEFAFTAMMFGALLVAQLSFLFGFKDRIGLVPAIFGAVSFGYAPFLLTNVLPQGRFPAVLALAFLPLVMAAVMAIIEHPTKRWWVVGLVATILSVCFHPMMFYIAGIGLAMIAIGTFLIVQTSWRRLALALAMVVLGVIASWIFLPEGITTLSVSNNSVGNTLGGGAGVRASTGFDSEIVPFSIRLNSFDYGLRDANENYAGIGLVIAAVTMLILSWRKRVLVYFAAALGCYVLATGTMTPFWDMIPLASALEPRRFLFPAYLAIGLVIGFGVNYQISYLRNAANRNRQLLAALGIGIVTIAVLFDAVPLAVRIAPDLRTNELSFSSAAAASSNDGRAFWNGMKDFAPYYFIGRLSGKDTIGRLAEIDSAVIQGFPERALRELALLDVRTVLTEEVQFGNLSEALRREGFVERQTIDTQVLLQSERPNSRVMQANRSVGLNGIAASRYWPSMLPDSIIISDLNSPLLDSVDAIVLSAYSIAEIFDVEHSLTEYVTNGGIVILEEPNLRGEDLFGIEGVNRVVPETLELQTAEGPLELKSFESGNEPFFGTFYDNAGDAVMIARASTGEVIPIIQKRSIGEGAVYWVCCNIGNHTIVNPGGDIDLALAVRSYFKTELGGYGEVWPEPFGYEHKKLGPSEFEFKYQSEGPAVAVLSVRAFDRRKVFLDGDSEIEMFPYGLVQAVVLPGGEHTVTVQANASFVTHTALGIWIIGLCAIAFLLRSLWGRLSKGPSPVGGFRNVVRRWIKEPNFVLELQTSGGVVRISEPRVGKRIDISSSSGARRYVRVESSDDGESVAAILVEVAAIDSSMTFDLAQLTLVSQMGAEYAPQSSNSIEGVDLAVPNLLYMYDTRSKLLDDVINLQPGQATRGLVIYKYTNTEPYPFIHDAFAALR